ncbi:unnamed protein product [Peniophora sp. CBMAI 1063]|nr:unnamed protein product [Peniophora sp. CBMAI 1063]
MSAFSRMQLAAALIEYDNDATDPDKPFRSAQESAIFAPARNSRLGPYPPRRNSNYLGVNLPSEGGSQSPRGTQLDGQHGRAPSSLSGLMVTNPFGKGADDEMEGEEVPAPAEDLEVDLASWGLDSFIPKDKEKARKKKGKGKAREVELPNPHDGPSRPASRAASVDLNNLGAGGAFLDSASTAPPPSIGPHRRSASSALELGGAPLEHAALPPRAHSLYLDSLSAAPEPPLHSVPFPAQSVRSASPGPSVNLGAARGHGRAHSTASWNSKLMLDHIEESRPNPFELEPPSPTRTSRFDPKAGRSRAGSIGSMGSRALLNEAETDTFSIRPPSPSRSSRFDPKSRFRVMSQASFGSRIMLEDNMSVMTGAPSQHPDRPVSTMELLRPKVLVMPSPLQGAPAPKGPPSAFTMREGFELRVAQDGTPLPPGARAEPHGMLTAAGSAPTIASNSFTPNPRANLSLSQLIFRNQLMVDGQRDVAYADIDQGLERATEDGQQIVLPEDEEEPARPVSVIVDDFARPAGKLYGRSLIDELESRKATTRNKQRVYYGDDRPSMMTRASSGRISTLIDPATLTQPPTLGGVPSPPANLQRQSSFGLKPLVDLGDNAPLAPPPRPGQMTRSVFGTDKLWEREMAKLKEIEAAEAVERAEREAREAVEAEKKQKKRKKKGKKGQEDESLAPAPSAESFAATGEEEAEPRVSIAPPVLPDIPRNITRGPPPPPGDDDEEEESDSDSDDGPRPSNAAQQTWFAGSSDDGKEASGPVRTVGVGLRYPNRARGARPSGAASDEDDSEEDMPLVATVSRAKQRATRLAGDEDDSDEDAPLTQVLAKRAGSGPAPVPSSSFNIDFDNLASSKPAATNADSDDEDDKPLGLRASRIPRGSDDEDDVPLGMHPDQQRRTQYAALVQQQQTAQQQQMLMQQMQMQQSMMFSNPSLMGSGFFAPPAMMTPAMNMNPMGMSMMPMAPPPSGSPPPIQDSNKINFVDQWRKNIAVDSQS